MAFSGQLLEAQLRAAQIWEATKNDPSKTVHVNTLHALMSESTARIDAAYSDPVKKRNQRMFWINRRCGSAAVNGRPGCELDYDELANGNAVFTLDNPVHDGFSNPYRDYETSVFDRNEPEAEGIIEAEGNLFKKLNVRSHSYINDPTRLTNVTLPGFTVDPSDNTIIIPPQQWTSKVFGIATRFKHQLGMKDPFIISGNALWDIMFDAKKDVGMEENIGKAARIRDHRVYTDFTLDTTLGEEKFFLIDRGVYTFLNRPDWKNTTPISLDGAGRLVWSKTATVSPVPNMVGVDGKPVTFKIDRHTQRTCVSGTDFLDQHGFSMNADIKKMPDADCTDDATLNGLSFVGKYTGAIAFKCGEPIVGSGS